MAKLNKVATTNEAVDEAVATNEAVSKSELYIPTDAAKQPSLNQLAIVLGIPAVRLQSAQVAYKPIEGQPYNPKTINWASVSAFIERRLDKLDYDTVEAVYEAALATEYTPRTRGNGSGGTTNKVLFGTTPIRKGDVKVGDTIYRKKDNAAFEVVFANDTIVVYEPKHEEGEKVVSEAIGNRMFNMNFATEPAAKAEAANGDSAEDGGSE